MADADFHGFAGVHLAVVMAGKISVDPDFAVMHVHADGGIIEFVVVLHGMNPLFHLIVVAEIASLNLVAVLYISVCPLNGTFFRLPAEVRTHVQICTDPGMKRIHTDRYTGGFSGKNKYRQKWKP